MCEIPSCSSDKEKEISLPLPLLKRKVSSVPKKMKSQEDKIIRQVKQFSSEVFNNERQEKMDELAFHKLLKNFDSLSQQSKTFLKMQLNMVNKNKMGRRFNMNEKLLALTLFKQSPKGYRLLEKIFLLPNKRTLNRLSEKICFEPGVNKKVFNYIQEVAKSWNTNKKLCTITFDEVALTPNLTYNTRKDLIEGFVELGRERKFKYCDHALVFMLRGVCSPWRQSLAYYFCEGTVSSPELVFILKDIVSEVAATGLIPVGLVCDQGSTFRSALRNIRQDTIRSRSHQGIRDYGTVEIAGMDLNIFYDPPHLLKSIRNNFLTKDIILDGKISSWKDIMFIFDIDSKLGHTRAMPKLTAHHVLPTKIKKMKVSVATQVLSARTAAMLKYTNALNILKDDTGRSTMANTAEIVEFFDKLFDSVNGSPGSSQRGKLRCAVKENSKHIQFWQEAIKKLKNLKFIDCTSKLAIETRTSRFKRVPCLEGWITTLESFIRVSKLLLTKYQVNYFYPRYVNQDPLENFFGRVRAVNYRNVNPDAHTFINTFKALLLSSILNPHSKFSNCEDDVGDTLISLNFIFEDQKSNKENVSPMSSLQLLPLTHNFTENFATQVQFEKIKVHCSAYTAGYICRKLSKYIKCKACIKTYIASEIDSIHSYIQFREYKELKRNNLAYPKGNFLRLYREAAQCIHTYLNMHCTKDNIKKD